MTLTDFLEEYSAELEGAVQRIYGDRRYIPVEDRISLVLEDEGLYTLALDVGVEGLE